MCTVITVPGNADRLIPDVLAHIIKLATQAMISVRSKASHFNRDTSDDHIPVATGDSFVLSVSR